jgi:hypothetical protein
MYVYNFNNKVFGHVLGDFVTNSSGHPDGDLSSTVSAQPRWVLIDLIAAVSTTGGVGSVTRLGVFTPNW